MKVVKKHLVHFPHDSVVVILLECPTSSHADAGDIIASHLPKWKNLRKVEVYYMNPVPILVVVGSCGKLDEVVIINPKHCTVRKIALPNGYLPIEVFFYSC